MGGGWGNSLYHLNPRNLNGTLGTALGYHEDTAGNTVFFDSLFWVIMTSISSSVIYLSSHGNVDSKSITEHHRAGGSRGVSNRVLYMLK